MSIDLITKLARELPELISYQHFEIDPSVYQFARDQFIFLFAEGEETTSVNELLCPTSTILPSPRMTISVKGQLHKLEESAGRIWCSFLHPVHKTWLVMGWMRPSVAPHVSLDTRLDNDDRTTLWGRMFTLAHVLSLINEPRIVARLPNGIRQQRRVAHRGMGFAVDAWTRVTWDLSKETVAKVSRDPGFHKVPFHWRRGHLRAALPHYNGAFQRPDAIRVEDRCLWWQWIEGQWVGHPAFGIKRSIHAPRLSGADIAHRRAA